MQCFHREIGEIAICKIKWIAINGSFTVEKSEVFYSTLKYYAVTLFVQHIQDVEYTKSNVGMY